MNKAVEPKKNKTAEDVVSKKKQPSKTGPVELNLDELKKVSGGLPKGGWIKTSTSRPIRPVQTGSRTGCRPAPRRGSRCCACTSRTPRL
jgi:hypothetical protein